MRSAVSRRSGRSGSAGTPPSPTPGWCGSGGHAPRPRARRSAARPPPRCGAGAARRRRARGFLRRAARRKVAYRNGHALQLDHGSRHAEPQVAGVFVKQPLDPPLLRFGRRPATAADEEKTSMGASRVRARDVRFAAFDPRDEPLGHREFERPVDGGRSDRTGAPELQRFDRFVGASRSTALPQRLRDLPPERRQPQPRAPHRDIGSATRSAGACFPQRLESVQGRGWIDGCVIGLFSYCVRKCYDIT